MVSIVPCTVAGTTRNGHSAARERGQQDDGWTEGEFVGLSNGTGLCQPPASVKEIQGLEAYVGTVSSRAHEGPWAGCAHRREKRPPP